MEYKTKIVKAEKVEESIKDFHFPVQNITVKASSLQKAVELLKEKIKN
jgi:hypothetical protein